MKEIKKLVRDNIPDIIVAGGKIPKIRVVKGHDLLLALNDKLLEEHNEYIAEVDDVKSVEELADMFEVIITLAKNKGFSREAFFKLAHAKALKNGGFDEGYFYEGNEE